MHISVHVSEGSIRLIGRVFFFEKSFCNLGKLRHELLPMLGSVGKNGTHRVVVMLMRAKK